MTHLSFNSSSSQNLILKMTKDDFLEHNLQLLGLFTLKVIFNSTYVDDDQWLKLPFLVCLNRVLDTALLANVCIYNVFWSFTYEIDQAHL